MSIARRRQTKVRSAALPFYRTCCDYQEFESWCAKRWIDRIDRAERKVFTTLPREAVKASPEYKGSAGIEREDETQLHDAHRRESHWNYRNADAPAVREIPVNARGQIQQAGRGTSGPPVAALLPCMKSN